MKDNLSIILKKLWVPFDGAPVQHRQGRRVISMAGGKRRIFAPTVRGEDFMQGGPMDSSGAVSLGRDLPSPSEMVKREEQEKILEKAKKQKNPGSIPVPKKWDRFKI